jgi:hypothetical protein
LFSRGSSDSDRPDEAQYIACVHAKHAIGLLPPDRRIVTRLRGVRAHLYMPASGMAGSVRFSVCTGRQGTGGVCCCVVHGSMQRHASMHLARARKEICSPPPGPTSGYRRLESDSPPPRMTAATSVGMAPPLRRRGEGCRAAARTITGASGLLVATARTPFARLARLLHPSRLPSDTRAQSPWRSMDVG